MNAPEAQVVFVDTPGYHKPRNRLGERLNDVVRSAWGDVDLVLVVVDAAAGIGRGDQRVVSDLAPAEVRSFCVVNKIDMVKKPQIAQALAAASDLGTFEEFVPVSAKTGEQVDLLRDLIVERMPEGPMYYGPETTLDQPPPLFVAELIREKLLSRVHKELPHSIAVVVEDYEERDDGLLHVNARIYVERESQKGIVIGRQGEALKAALTTARLETEALFGRKVFIEAQVRVEKDWQRRDYALDRLGFS